MKKIIILLSAICLLSLSLRAQDSTKKDNSTLTIKEVYNDAKSGFKDLFSNLQETASKLEGPAKHVYQIYVYQHRAEGVANLIAYFIFFFLPTIMFFRLMLSKSIVLVVEDDITKFGGLAIYTGIISFISLIALVFSISSIYTHITNPEYYAIQDIIKAFK